ncbi:MAG TPA: hypothetical protein VMN81_00865 [Vicinamibacterales bacterium]|nr:hypothetical protein [Vicinamibacterales bacterium]
MLAPRAAYLSAVASAKADAGPIEARGSYILQYVFFISLLVAGAASVSATGRVTLSMLVSLGISWMFLPLLHVLAAAALVASAPRPAAGGNRAVALLLMGHAPWSIWILLAAAMAAAFGYHAWHPMLFAALVPIALTFRIVHAFCLEVLRTSPRGAIACTLLHQSVTGLVGVVYLEKTVGLVPRIYGWLS